MKKSARLSSSLAIFAILACAFFRTQAVHAAVFNNLTGWKPADFNASVQNVGGAKTHLFFTYVSTTAQIEITDVSFALQGDPQWATVSSSELTITTDQGSWVSNPGTCLYNCGSTNINSYATTTYTFPAGSRPYATVGTPYSFYFDAPNTASTTRQIYQPISTTSVSMIPVFELRDESNTTLFDYRGAGYYPKILINSGGLGALTVTFPSPQSTSTTSIVVSPSFACPDWGIFTPLCSWTVWLIVPDTTTWASIFADLKQSFVEVFPFSYIASVQNAITNAESETSSTNLTVTLPFASTVATNTSFGAWAPDVVAFSSSTVQRYIPALGWTWLRLLLAMGVYVGTGEMIYFGIQRLFSQKSV